MDDSLVANYWCHACSQMVDPVMDVEIKCPFCDSDFMEEMDVRSHIDEAAELVAEGMFTRLRPFLLEMMRRRSRRSEDDDDDHDDEEEDDSNQEHGYFSFSSRRRRRRQRQGSASAILQLLQDLHEGLGSESDTRQRERESDRESLVLMNPFNQALVIDGSGEGSNNSATGTSLDDYFLGSGLDLLLQHLAENDPNRYGTPPAEKEAVQALPTKKIVEASSCSICLEDFDIGSEVREMPCKHVFHGDCILPWLEMHSSCPVCRFQLPADESKVSNSSGNGNSVSEGNNDGNNDVGGRRGEDQLLFPMWPFNGLFSNQGSQNGGDFSSN